MLETLLAERMTAVPWSVVIRQTVLVNNPVGGVVVRQGEFVVPECCTFPSFAIRFTAFNPATQGFTYYLACEFATENEDDSNPPTYPDSIVQFNGLTTMQPSIGLCYLANPVSDENGFGYALSWLILRPGRWHAVMVQRGGLLDFTYELLFSGIGVSL